MTAPFTPEDLAWFEEQKVVVPPVATTEEPRLARRQLPPGLLGGLTITAVVLAVVALFWALLGNASSGTPSVPVAREMDPSVLVMALAAMGPQKLAESPVQTLVEDKDVSPLLPEALIGHATTLYAVGTVEASVDLSQVGRGAVDVHGDDVTITLPAPVLSAVHIDPVQSQITSRERGLVDRLSDAIMGPEGDQKLFQLAQDRLDAVASRDQGITAQAVAEIRQRVTDLATSLGYRHVTVTFEPGR